MCRIVCCQQYRQTSSWAVVPAQSPLGFVGRGRGAGGACCFVHISASFCYIFFFQRGAFLFLPEEAGCFGALSSSSRNVTVPSARSFGVPLARFCMWYPFLEMSLDIFFLFFSSRVVPSPRRKFFFVRGFNVFDGLDFDDGGA